MIYFDTNIYLYAFCENTNDEKQQTISIKLIEKALEIMQTKESYKIKRCDKSAGDCYLLAYVTLFISLKYYIIVT